MAKAKARVFLENRRVVEDGISFSICSGPVAGSVGFEGGVVSGVINSNHLALERQAGDHAMKTVTTTPELLHATTESNSHLFDDWFDPIEAGVRDRVRGDDL